MAFDNGNELALIVYGPTASFLDDRQVENCLLTHFPAHKQRLTPQRVLRRICRGLPEPARASTDHRLALARDVLMPGSFLSCRGERFKPTLDFQVFTEAWALDIFNVIVANAEFGPSGGDRAPGQGFPACVVQQFHRGRIIQMLHEIDLREPHQR